MECEVYWGSFKGDIIKQNIEEVHEIFLKMTNKRFTFTNGLPFLVMFIKSRTETRDQYRGV